LIFTHAGPLVNRADRMASYKVIRHTGPHAVCAGTDVSETRDFETLSGSSVSGTY